MATFIVVSSVTEPELIVNTAHVVAIRRSNGKVARSYVILDREVPIGNADRAIACEQSITAFIHALGAPGFCVDVRSVQGRLGAHGEELF